MNLDGETNLKRRNALEFTRDVDEMKTGVWLHARFKMVGCAVVCMPVGARGQDLLVAEVE